MKTRRLTFESLQSRQVMAGNIGAIGGLAEAAEVSLIQNGRTLATAPVVGGQYRFDGLRAGDYTVRGGGRVMDVKVVDDDGQRVVSVDSLAQPFPAVTVGPNSVRSISSGVDAGIVGGERDVTIKDVARGALTVFNVGGQLSIGSVGRAAGRVTLQYDGVDRSGALNRVGLGDVSLNNGDAKAGLVLSLSAANVGAYTQVVVYSGSTLRSTATVPVPKSDDDVQVFIPFSAFVGNADFNRVGAIEVNVAMSPSNDISVALLESVKPVLVTANLNGTATPSNSIGMIVGNADPGDIRLWQGNRLIATTTVSQGRFQFTGLQAGTYTVEGSKRVNVTVTNESVRSVLIDDFALGGQGVVMRPGQASSGVSSQVSSGILGGDRDIIISPVSRGSLTAFVDQGQLTIGSQGRAEGQVTIQYDGIGTPDTLNRNGLGGVSLSQGNTFGGLVLELGADKSGDFVDILIHSSGGRSSVARVAIPQVDGVTKVFVPFRSFVGDADFRSVGAIEAKINLSANNDVYVSVLEAVKPAETFVDLRTSFGAR